MATPRKTTIVGWNIVVFLVLLSVVILVPGAISDAIKFTKKTFSLAARKDKRADLPNYDGIPWAQTYFREDELLQTEYFDYIIWRRMPFSGETIHIDTAGFRVDPAQRAKSPADAQLWVFGGSTVWGTGVRDAETIPAFLEKHTGLASFNFGESAYVAHQSLNLLMKTYVDGGGPRFVVFYDGVNEVSHKCRVGVSASSSSEEAKIRSWAGRRLSGDEYLLPEVFAPTSAALSKLFSGKKQRPDAQANIAQNGWAYDCDKSPSKAAAIARALVLDWQTARFIVESHGGHFVPILQPMAYTGHPNLSHLPDVRDDSVLRKQYEVLYGEVRRQLDSQSLPYVDLTTAVDGDSRLYIDFCHLIPSGNEQIARAIVPHLSPR